MCQDSLAEQIRKARARFACMAATYSLMVFNDNFFKQSALVLAVAAGRTEMQGYALGVFTLPFILFAAPAGWLADRFPKRQVVIGAKWVELLAMVCGAFGVWTGNWLLIFAMLGLMGMQSAAFSPALNGAIPELYPASHVTKANAILRVFVTAAILAGTALAGIVLDTRGEWRGIERGRLFVGVWVIAVAAFGVLASYGVARRPAASPGRRFPWTGPADTMRVLGEIWSDRLLALTLAADVFVWFLGSLQILLINPLGIQQFEFSKTTTSLLIMAELSGLALGGLVSGKIASGSRWWRVMGPSGIALSSLMLLVPVVCVLPLPVRTVGLFVIIGAIGLAGGIFIIPMESFLQVRPRADRKGAVWAAANFVVFIGILISCLVSNALNEAFRPTTGFAVAGGLAFVFSLWLAFAFPRRGREDAAGLDGGAMARA